MKMMLSQGQRNGRTLFGGVLFGFCLAVAAFLAVAVLIWSNREAFSPPGIGEAKAAIRTENLQKLRQETDEAINSYAVINAVQGIYQVPIDRAMELTAQEWQDQVKANDLLSERVDKVAVAPDSTESFE